MLQQLVGTSLLLFMMTETIYKADSKSCNILQSYIDACD